MANKIITLKIEDKEYKLEFTRASVIEAHRLGLSILDNEDSESSFLVKSFDLFRASFLKNHSKLNNEVIADIFAKTNGKDKLLEKLAEMYLETLNSLFPEQEKENDDEGNTNWEVNW